MLHHWNICNNYVCTQSGSLRVTGRFQNIPYMMSESATYEADSTFDQRLATGFVTLWGLQSIEANKAACKGKFQQIHELSRIVML